MAELMWVVRIKLYSLQVTKPGNPSIFFYQNVGQILNYFNQTEKKTTLKL